MSVQLANGYAQEIEEAIRTDLDWYTTPSGGTYYVGTTFATPPTPQKAEMNTRTGTVQVKAGFVGQVYATEPSSMAKVILWESAPKKTVAKADKAAQKAQLRAAQRSFE